MLMVGEINLIQVYSNISFDPFKLIVADIKVFLS